MTLRAADRFEFGTRGLSHYERAACEGFAAHYEKLGISEFGVGALVDELRDRRSSISAATVYAWIEEAFAPAPAGTGVAAGEGIGEVLHELRLLRLEVKKLSRATADVRMLRSALQAMLDHGVSGNLATIASKALSSTGTGEA
jgi:hypothetical protein